MLAADDDAGPAPSRRAATASEPAVILPLARRPGGDGGEERSPLNRELGSPDKERHVPDSGRARFIDDPTRRQARRSAATEDWFPNGPDDPEVGLLEVGMEGAGRADDTVRRLAKRTRSAVIGEPAAGDQRPRPDRPALKARSS